jgi:hypothetical protein
MVLFSGRWCDRKSVATYDAALLMGIDQQICLKNSWRYFPTRKMVRGAIHELHRLIYDFLFSRHSPCGGFVRKPVRNWAGAAAASSQDWK